MASPVRYGELAPHPPEGSLDLPSLLVGDGPIEIDVGFGRGHSIIERARGMPGVRLLGIEIKAKHVFRLHERCEREGLSVCLWHGDVREILGRVRPDGCLDRVSVHFPDPWWKKRHRKRVVVGDVLLDHVARLLRLGGELFVQTDVRERGEQYLAQIANHGSFELGGAGGFVSQNPFGVRSNREVRADMDGLPIHRIVAVRR